MKPNENNYIAKFASGFDFMDLVFASPQNKNLFYVISQQ